MSKTNIVTWNSNDYASIEAAKADGAINTHTIPSDVPPQAYGTYINAFVWGLMSAGDRLSADVNAIQYDIEEVKLFTMTGKVLEWNTYEFSVEAMSADEALKIASEKGILAFSKQDVEYGSESAPMDAKITEKDIKVGLLKE